MKLDTLDRELPVPYPHDFISAALFAGRPGGDLETGRQALGLDHQRVIASRLEGIRKTLEYTGITMMNQ